MELSNVMETEKKITILGKECTVRKMTFGDLVAYKKYLEEEKYRLSASAFKQAEVDPRDMVRALSAIKVTDEEVEDALSSMDGVSFLMSRLITGLTKKELYGVDINDISQVISYVIPQDVDEVENTEKKEDESHGL